MDLNPYIPTEKSVCKIPYIIFVCKLPTPLSHTDFCPYVIRR